MLDFLKRLFRGRKAPTEPEEPSDSGSRAIFWFNWTEMSGGGRNYGRLAYQHLLPHFSPNPENWDPGNYFFADGDYISRGSAMIPVAGPDAENCMARVAEIGSDACYLIAVSGGGLLAFSNMDTALSSGDHLGYIGMTPCGSLDVSSFWQLADSLSLVPSCEIWGRNFRKKNFTFLDDEELQALGFNPRG